MSTRYLTNVAGQAAIVEITSRTDGRVQATVTFEETGETREVSFEHHAGEAGRYHLSLDDGRVVVGRVMTNDFREFSVTGSDARIDVRAMNEMDALLGGDGMGADDGSVTVSMPGRVVKILVDLGATVEAGQPVMVVEAMKMENEVKAGRAGIVDAIHVTEGESVEAEALLMTIGEADA